MARYQLRTPENVVIEDVIDEMAGKAWQILEAWDVFEAEKFPAQSYSHFREHLSSATAPYIRAYKLCGTFNICLEEVTGTPWAIEVHSLDACPSDLVYHLFPKTELDDFLNDIAEKAADAIRSLLKPETERGVLSTLRVVFRCVLGNYLYYSPICGEAELCVYSSQ